MERGPNYDWKHEAEHYRDECGKLRELVDKLERSLEMSAPPDTVPMTRELLRQLLSEIPNFQHKHGSIELLVGRMFENRPRPTAQAVGGRDEGT